MTTGIPCSASANDIRACNGAAGLIVRNCAGFRMTACRDHPTLGQPASENLHNSGSRFQHLCDGLPIKRIRLATSLHLDAGFVDNRFPLPRLLIQRCGELLWCSNPCFHADGIQAGADLG